MKKLLYLFIALTTIMGTISCKSQGNKNDSQVAATDSLTNEEAETDHEPWKVRDQTSEEGGTQLLNLFYGMDNGDSYYSYQGINCILDTLPGILRWEKFGTWRQRLDSIKFEASLCLYVDSVFPTQAIAQSIAVYTDTILRREFCYYMSDKKVPRMNLKRTRTGMDLADLCNRFFDIQDKRKKAITPKDDTLQQALPFRVALVNCQVYNDEKYSTYILETSVDYNGSCGCPSSAMYVTYDKEGRALQYEDFFDESAKPQIESLLYESFQEVFVQKYGERADFIDSWKFDVPLHCALVKEGVLFYFEPYVIGPGAEGQYNLILRHHDIKDLLKLSH